MENISIFDVLDTKEINGIEKTLGIIVSRLGVNVDFDLTEEKIYDGRIMVKVESTDFQTVPVIYKSIHIDGSGFVVRDEALNDVYHLSISLSYRFDYFGGGENGVNIGVCKFVIFTKTGRVACNGLTIRD